LCGALSSFPGARAVFLAPAAATGAGALIGRARAGTLHAS
jgi:hypothetical protein